MGGYNRTSRHEREFRYPQSVDKELNKLRERAGSILYNKIKTA